MKATFPFLPLVWLLASCAGPKPQPIDAALFSPIPEMPASRSPVPEVRERGQPPPWIYVGKRHLRSPGKYSWNQGMTVTDAIRLAGGFKDEASHHLQVEHWDGTSESYSFWRRKLTDDRGNPAVDPALRPGDAVTVVVY